MTGQEEIERGTWTGKLDFILSAIGYAVGIGNVWRFPYLAYKNGGASFLFPYILMLFIAGLPLFFIELAIGQFSSQGPMTCWQMAPVFTGIGYGMVLLSAVCSIYYNMIICYALYYMMVSFVHLDDTLPWETCDNSWNNRLAERTCRTAPLPRLEDYADNRTELFKVFYKDLYVEDCVEGKFNISAYSDYNKTSMSSVMYDKFTEGFATYLGLNLTETAFPELDDVNASQIQGYVGFKDCEFKYVSPAEEYYKFNVLNELHNESLNDIGSISLKLALTLFLGWIIMFACLMKGIKTSGKVVYFTATFPYAVLIVLLVRGVTLEGAVDGLKFYVVPKWDKFKDATIWGDAATQIFYSLGIGFGGLLTMASYNKFNHNCRRDAVLVAVLNCSTSIFAGFAIFSMLGHMAYVTNQKVEDVATSGTGLAFVAYPDGISRLPASPIWAFLFFFMLVTLGMDSQFAMLETIISAVSDLFPNVLRRIKTPFTFVVCMVGFLLGLPLCTEGGGRVLTLMNWYSGAYNLLLLALFEIICCCYVYGVQRFRKDIEMMVGSKPGPYWYVNWCVITPLAVAFIIIVSAIQYTPMTHSGKTVEKWAEGLGWAMDMAPILLVIIVAIVQMCRLGPKQAFKPAPDWGPACPEDRKGRYAPPDDGVTPYIPYYTAAPPYNGIGENEKGQPLEEKKGNLNQGFDGPVINGDSQNTHF